MSSNKVFIIIYKSSIEFYDFGGHHLKTHKFDYEVLFLTETQGIDNKKILLIVGQDLKIYTYSLNLTSVQDKRPTGLTFNGPEDK